MIRHVTFIPINKMLNFFTSVSFQNNLTSFHTFLYVNDPLIRALPAQWYFLSASLLMNLPSTKISIHSIPGKSLTSSHKYPVYNHTVFVGKRSLISRASLKTTSLLCGCNGSPPENVTPLI